jgi:glycosyltransferase involved in cell wall biosynthesis
MRIVMIGLRGVPACHGGVERAVEELGADLAARGHEVIVFCRSPYYRQRPKHYRGMRLVYLPTTKRRGLESFVHSALASVAALRFRADVVHYHALGPGLFSPITRLFSRATVVQTIHGLDDERGKWGSGARRVLRCGRWMSERVPHLVLAVSADLTKVYKKRRRGPTEYISNGVRPVPDRPEADVTGGLPYGLTPRGYFLHVGRLVPEKGADVLLDAYRKLKTDLPLLIVGASSHTDEYSAALRKLAALDERVIMAGWMDGPELSPLYAAARAFIIPSKLEGMPLVLLEACAHGSPIIASDIPPHVEVLRHAAPGHRLFQDGDVLDLLEAMRDCLETPLAVERRNATALRDEVLADYSWPAIAEQVEEAYERAAAHRHRRAASRRRWGRRSKSATISLPSGAPGKSGRSGQPTDVGPPRLVQAPPQGSVIDQWSSSRWREPSTAASDNGRTSRSA